MNKESVTKTVTERGMLSHSHVMAIGPSSQPYGTLTIATAGKHRPPTLSSNIETTTHPWEVYNDKSPNS